MFELSIKGDIASAHFLRGYPGKCKDLHGHTWKVEVFLQKKELNDIGMVEDFAILKTAFKSFLEHLDHKCLNDLDYFKEINPTAENIAKYIYQNFSKETGNLNVTKVQVWESDLASASYFES